MIDPHFVILGAVISIAGGLNYIVHTLQGRTRPNRVTWFMWALAPMIAFAAEIREGVGLIALMTFMAGFVPLLVFVASFINKKAVWQLTKFDIGCGLLSLLGLVLWIITGEGNVAIALAIIADGFAALPTIVKSYSYPESESWLVFLGGGVSALIATLTIKDWTFAHFGFPLYIVGLNLILILLVRFEIGKLLRREFS